MQTRVGCKNSHHNEVMDDEMWLRVVESSLARLPADAGVLLRRRTARIGGGTNPRSGSPSARVRNREDGRHRWPLLGVSENPERIPEHVRENSEHVQVRR
jgi:hypothetical protein